MSVRKHRDPRVRKREELRVRRRALHKHRSGFHEDTKRKEERAWQEQELYPAQSHDE
jgi:hypothetical protein